MYGAPGPVKGWSESHKDAFKQTLQLVSSPVNVSFAFMLRITSINKDLFYFHISLVKRSIQSLKANKTESF